METFLAILAILFGLAGIVGSIAPALPGPPLGWLGLLILYIWGGGTNGAGEPMSTSFLLVWLAIVVVVLLLQMKRRRRLLRLRDKVIAEETEKYEAVTNELKQKGIPIPENKE